MDYLSVTHLSQYQHYLRGGAIDRAYLHDPALRSVSAPSRLTFGCCLLLASENDNKIPLDYRWLSDRIGRPVSARALAPLLAAGLLSLSGADAELALEVLPCVL